MFNLLFFFLSGALMGCAPQKETIERKTCSVGTILMEENEKRTDNSILILSAAQVLCLPDGDALNFVLSEKLVVPPTKPEIRKVGVYAFLTDAKGVLLQDWAEEVPLERPAFTFTHAQEFVIPSPFGNLSDPSHKIWFGLR